MVSRNRAGCGELIYELVWRLGESRFAIAISIQSDFSVMDEQLFGLQRLDVNSCYRPPSSRLVDAAGDHLHITGVDQELVGFAGSTGEARQ